MSISHHQLIAEAWTHLQGRSDTATMLSEIAARRFGDKLWRHAYRRPITQTEKHEAIQEAMELVTWIKTILDLQRSYLQATADVQDDCSPDTQKCLLTSKAVYNAMLFLIRIKTAIFPPRYDIQAIYTADRIYLLHALVSGMRLLSLRNNFVDPSQHLSYKEKLVLVDSIFDAWVHPRMIDLEVAILTDLIPTAGEYIPEKVLDRDETRLGYSWAELGVPKYRNGLVSSSSLR